MTRSNHCGGPTRRRSPGFVLGLSMSAVIGFSGVVSADPPGTTGDGVPRADVKAPAHEGPAGGARRPARAGRTAGRKQGGKKVEERPEAGAPGAGPSAEEEEARRYSVECLLDKTKCPPREEPPPPPPEPPSPESLLPEKLEMADINEGTRPARAAAAIRCKELARGGEAVKIKLSIAGPSGTVVSAGPEDDAGNPELAACCAEELKAASFKRVRKPQIGAVTTIKF